MKNKIILFIIVFAAVIISVVLIVNRKNNEPVNINDVINEDDKLETWDETNDIDIDLSSQTSSDNKNYFDNDILYIKNSGVYHISGELKGYINIDTKDDAMLVLDNAKISSENYSSIHVENANKVIITLAENSKNYVSDSGEYKVNADDEPDGVIFSKDDLTINGKGYLQVISSYEDGIVCKDELKIINSSIDITSNDDGIRGKDSVSLTNATIKIESLGDGIKSTNDSDESLGYIKIYSGTYNIISNKDGINAETNVVIESGNFDIETNDENLSESSKGIKAKNLIQINAGTLKINSSDDAVHSNNEIIINNGDFEISSLDDAFHADKNLKINNGNINILSSYEGLESESIEINDGKINIISSDDGINAAGGNDESGAGGREREPGNFSSGTGSIVLNGGYIYINSLGDGFDSNGSAEMNAGTLIISGPTNGGNGALDFDKSFEINGGLLIAAGSTGMVQVPSSNQNTLNITFNSVLEEKTIVHIEDESGNSILTYEPEKKYQSLVICSPEIKDNTTYKVFYDGNSTGVKTNGIYEGGEYSNGIEFMNATVNNKITSIGSNYNEMPGRRNMR